MKQRTTTQNRSLHKYCSKMAESLELAGFDQIKFYDTLKDGFSVKWTMEAFKAFFRSVAHDLYPEVESTAELTTEQIQHVYNIIDRGVSEKTGVRNEWPSKQSMDDEARGLTR